MRKFALVVLALAASLAAPAALTREPALAAVDIQAKQAMSYGSDPLQALDFWRGRSPNAPLVIFVHGGGWSRGDKRMMDRSDKLRHWQALGYAVVSLNYRLVPEATVEQQAQDVADALALLKRRSGELGIDPRRVALVGHSAGAHLVALVGTDPAYLRQAGLSFDDIAGIVPLDGAAYDVPAQMSDGPRVMQSRYRQAFGTDPARQVRLSPTRQAGAPNAARFLILHVQREDGVRQSEGLAAALKSAGANAEVRGFPGKGLRGHAEINRQMGDPEYPATAVLDAFFARIFG